MVDLTGRVAVVTGAGSGIGRSIALRLAECGAKVGLIGRTESSLSAVAGEAKGETLVAPADVADQAALNVAMDRIVEAFGPLHITVANAGIGGPDELDGEDRWGPILRTNLDGAYYTLRAFERNLAPGGEPTQAIVISSCVARFGVPGIAAYSTAKAGQLGLVRSLAVELAPKGVRVNAICPGWVETEMAVDRMTEIADAEGRPYSEVREDLLDQVPLQRISDPDEMAGLVEFLVSPAAVGFTGQAFDPNNGSWMG